MRYAQDINFLIDLAKGRISSTNKHSHFFYRLFTRKVDSYMLVRVETVAEAQEMLSEAWWIEEEDIRQTLYLLTCKSYRRGAHPKSWFLRNLGYGLSDWLIQQKVNVRYANWEQLYGFQNKQIDEDNALENLYCCTETDLLTKLFLNQEPIYECFNGLNNFEKYLIYLHYSMELSYAKIAYVLLTSSKQVNFYFQKLKKKLEGLNVRMSISKRSS